jgi:hypothetical protein
MEREVAEALRQEILDNNDPVTAALMLGELFTINPEFHAALHGQEIAPGVRIQNPGPDPARTAAKLIARAQAAAADYVAGMQAPRRDPKAAALRAEGKWGNNVQAAVREGRYAAGIRQYDQAEAVRIATSDGGAAYTAGVTKREAKIIRVHQKLMPILGGVSQAIQNMPQDTEVQREQRLVATLRAMRNVGKQMRGMTG